MRNNNTYLITVSALCGAAYAVLTMLLAPISYGAIQFRLSEALCVLPWFVPGTAWGLFLGCLAANFMTGNIFDVIFGSLATLLAGLCTARLGRGKRSPMRELAGAMMPVLFNSLVIGGVITQAYNGLGIFSHPGLFALNCAQIALGEAGVMLLLGLPLMRILPGNRVFREFMDKIK